MPKHLPEAESLARRDAVVAGIKSGKTLFAIGQELRINAGSVYWIVKKYGIDPKTGDIGAERCHRKNILTEEQHKKRAEKMRGLLNQGFNLHAIADKLSMSYGTMHHFVKKYGLRERLPRPTTTSGRLAIRKTTYMYGGIEKWQQADPDQFPDDIITEAVRMIGCDRRHAAWVLSCPSGGNASGWRGGSAIG